MKGDVAAMNKHTRSFTRIITIFLIGLSSVILGNNQSEVFSVETILNLKYVSQPSMDPTGKYIAYTLSVPRSANDKPGKSLVKRIFSLRKKLVIAHKALNANREVIQAIESERTKFFSQDFLRRLRFIYYDIVQLIDSKDTYREILTGSLDMYVSSVSNNLNSIMKTARANRKKGPI